MDIDFREDLKAFGELDDSLNTSSLRILAFVALTSIQRALVAKDYRAAGDDAEILVAAIRALAKREAT